jgi:hypothetical protein
MFGDDKMLVIDQVVPQCGEPGLLVATLPRQNHENRAGRERWSAQSQMRWKMPIL